MKPTSVPTQKHIFGRRAFDIAHHLATVVGPRPAASEGESQGLAYAEQLFVAAGAQVSHFPVDNIPPPRSHRWIKLTFLAILLVVTYVFHKAPVAALLYLPLILFFPRLLRALRKGKTVPSGQNSYNLIAEHAPQDEEAAGVLIIGAHIDTAGSRRVPGSLLPRLQRLAAPITLPLAFGLALLSVAKVLTDWLAPLPPQVWLVVRWAGFGMAALLALLEMAYLLLAREQVFSPGANDNGSSVGVILAAAEHFANSERLPRRLALRYALWTGEERGLIGSARYAKEADLEPDRTWVLNLDMVGTGKSLSYVRRAGFLPSRPTSPLLNGLLQRALPSIQEVNYFMRSSDFKPFLDRAFPAASLTGKGGRRNWYYHTSEDTSEHLQTELLEDAALAVIGLAAKLDQSLVESN